jgi:predicted ATPase
MTFIRSIQLTGFLSFPPDSGRVDLSPLNVLIGPNGSGKSNVIEALSVLRSTPTGLAALIREGGTAQEWLWKGEPSVSYATIDAITAGPQTIPSLRYRLTFAAAGLRMEVLDEAIEDAQKKNPQAQDVYFYYRFQRGHPVLNVRLTNPVPIAPQPAGTSPIVEPLWPSTTTTTQPPWAPEQPRIERRLRRESLVPDESVLSQRKDPDLYPEVTWLGQQFARMQVFSNWTFGRTAPLRRPQGADLPADVLLDYSENLGMVLNELQHADASTEFNRLLSRFLPRYQRLSTRIQGNTVQFYLHEDGLKTPIPATRLSDGTLRFMAILALLLTPSPPPLLCIDEPELGLHPDAVTLLADLLVDASQRTQLIVTTHSDALVSALTDHAGSILVCEHRGGTQLERVDPDKLKHWLEKYQLGEIWRIGEIGGNP